MKEWGGGEEGRGGGGERGEGEERECSVSQDCPPQEGSA